MADSPLFGRVALLGIGLIGSSLARVLRRDRLARRIVAVARTAATRDTALRLGIADEVTADAPAAVAGADLVVLAVPMGAYRAIAEAIGPALAPGAIVTDVGSVKRSALADVAPHLPAHVHFVPGHPIAGTEYSGPEAGFDTLFEGRWCILTPPPGTDPRAVERVAELWRRAGSMIEVMDAEHHDKVMAITSHLPHVIAYTIVGTVVDLEQATQREVVKFAASGFRDFTRIAASDPIMWRDVFLYNRDAVLEMLQRFNEDLTRLQRAIRRGEADTLEDWFTRTREIRRGIIDAGQA
ncbi:MAG: prephenate/arogenate dehydrogenase family protein [Alphaproteobacteria bacterium]